MRCNECGRVVTSQCDKKQRIAKAERKILEVAKKEYLLHNTYTIKCGCPLCNAARELKAAREGK